jgi:hypothetical protein
MYVRSGAWAEGEEAAGLGNAHRRERAVSAIPPPSFEREGALDADATFLQRHWWLWPVNHNQAVSALPRPPASTGGNAGTDGRTFQHLHLHPLGQIRTRRGPR